MSHEAALNVEAVIVGGVNSFVVDSTPLDTSRDNPSNEHSHKSNGFSTEDSGPPPSCSRKLRKYSFLILVNKYILYAVNCLIWLGGLFLVAFGVWARLEDSTVGYLQLLPFDPVALLIALGSLSVVISFFGCIGSVRENVLFLKIFCGAIGCLFIVELASCVVGFVSVNSIKDAVIAKFYTSMELYDEDDQIRGLVDRIQKDYQCCGAIGPNDWDRNLYYNCTANFNFAAARSENVVSNNALPSACGVPSSCCRSSSGSMLSSPGAALNVVVKQPGSSSSRRNNNNLFSSSSSPSVSSNGNPVASFPGFPLNDQCGFGIRRLQPSEQSSEIFIAGCADHMTESLSQNLLYVAVVALAISCFELISILLAFMLIRRITTVIEYMVYIRSGHFVEVDPMRLPHRSAYSAPLVVTASDHNQQRHQHRHRRRHDGGHNNISNNNNSNNTNNNANRHRHARGLLGRFSFRRGNDNNNNDVTLNNNNNNNNNSNQNSNNSSQDSLPQQQQLPATQGIIGNSSSHQNHDQKRRRNRRSLHHQSTVPSSSSTAAGEQSIIVNGCNDDLKGAHMTTTTTMMMKADAARKNSSNNNGGNHVVVVTSTAAAAVVNNNGVHQPMAVRPPTIMSEMAPPHVEQSLRDIHI